MSKGYFITKRVSTPLNVSNITVFSIFISIDIFIIKAGYAGGVKKNPTYEETCQKLAKGQHAEVVRVVYHPDKITVSVTLSEHNNMRFAFSMKNY